ncbi:hypothetical protein SOVF_185350 [Spinacia oleracea]|nr:hypothetical protein SOVF_185350 [Spinacia oleracea]
MHQTSLNTIDATRKIWLHCCKESIVNMLADKQFCETERKAKAQLSHINLHNGAADGLCRGQTSQIPAVED